MALLIRQNETIKVVFPQNTLYFTEPEVASLVNDLEYESVVLNLGILFFSVSAKKNELLSEFLNTQITGNALFVAFKDLSDEFQLQSETDETTTDILKYTSGLDSRDVDFVFLETLKNFSTVSKITKLYSAESVQNLQTLHLTSVSEIKSYVDSKSIYEFLVTHPVDFSQNSVVFRNSETEIVCDSPEPLLQELIDEFTAAEEYEKCATLVKLQNGKSRII